MRSKVAIVELESGEAKEPLMRAVELLGGLEDLDLSNKPVVVKVGVFSHKTQNHTSVNVLDAIISLFDKAPKVLIAESDNYKGTGSERLQLWKELFTRRVIPVNLSDDPEPKKIRLAGKEIDMPSLLLKPKVLIDTHILRSFESGSILKNLFGCILDAKRAKYHKILPALLADIYEAIGGVDLAVIDGTYFWRGAGGDPVPMNVLVVGKDAVAVDTVGAALAGLGPEKMPVIREFVERGLGEGVLENIEIVGASLEGTRKKLTSAAKVHQKQRRKRAGPQTWGGHANQQFAGLVREGFFKQPEGRTSDEITKALEKRGLSTKGKEKNIADILSRRVKRGVLKKHKRSNAQVSWADSSS
jgi:uncharacterized protein (DUF362 family)